MHPAALHTPLRRLLSSRRLAPTNARASSSQAGTSVPREKMRALVSLYHESSKFITPEKLSEVIDYEFATAPLTRNLIKSDEDSYWTLDDRVNARRQRSKIGDTSTVLAEADEGEQWSSTRTAREHMVRRALYGTEQGQDPGLEVLEEEGDRIREMLKKDKESKA
ncbi:uncharacterized protein LAESUDRAFT_689970 [Laetiporus sulphureus 93-53]|uniref:Uncharacterized protein n=1 Tax=Laetiporus sulphureus 93-53 TaxID=1314785 RepID=A0A165IE86_9APHY|nr:uncharacterized protein LAESUDRAFT_689970 [Laetiporus sulphureus 93-53]KZT12956.1 hypothetical protein LAESUDRAFT_689970 [Laetiporus sulphureus 93-53]